MDETAHGCKLILDKISARRAHVIRSLKVPDWMKPRWLTHALAPVLSLTIMIIVFANTHQLNIFTFHPLFMSLAFLLCMSEGVVAYRNRTLLDALGPIMQHGTKTKSRTIHMTLQMLGAGFALLGFLFILASKLKKGRTTVPHTLHSLMGTLVLLLLVVQAVVGSWKYDSLTAGVIDSRNSANRYRWHGKMGLLLYDLACATVMTGLMDFLGLSLWAALTIVLVGCLWLNTNMQMHESKHVYAPMQNDTDGASTELVGQGDDSEDDGIPEIKGDHPV